VQLREKLPQFEAAGVRVVCVIQGTAEEGARFCGRHGLPHACIPDPEKESYRAMGFGRTSWRKMLAASKELKERRAEAKELGCGVSLAGTLKKNSDIMQLPGAALIDRGGRILWIHRGTHPADLPSADDLLRIAQDAMRDRKQ
jgi:peroxiredoxin